MFFFDNTNDFQLNKKTPDNDTGIYAIQHTAGDENQTNIHITPFRIIL